MSAELAQTTLSDHFRAADPGNAHRVLVFDQFEEILTADPADTKAKEEFFRQVGELLEAPRLLLLLCDEGRVPGGPRPVRRGDPEPIPEPVPPRLFEGRPGSEAIHKPLPEGFDFQPQALEKLLDDLRQLPTRGTSAPLLGETIEPYQLQVVCTRIWDAPDRVPGRSHG